MRRFLGSGVEVPRCKCEPRYQDDTAGHMRRNDGVTISDVSVTKLLMKIL